MDGSGASALRRGFGGVLLAAGVGVFAIRLHHPGPYAVPGGGNLLAGVLALGLGVWLVRDWLSGPLATPFNLVVSIVGAIVLFFALYAVFAELEETVTLRVTPPNGDGADLRLWIVDRAGTPWVSMPRAKADAHGLTERRAELLRDGAWRCVVATRDESREANDTVHRMRHEKYAVQRLATTLGMFGETAGADTVSLRLDPCPDA